MTQNDTVDTSRVGNTRTRSYCFTFNNYSEKDIGKLVSFFDTSNKFIFQEEKGENGTPHLQGFVQWKSARWFTSLKKYDKRIHWEKAKSIKGSIEYCSKSESRVGKIYKKNVTIKAPLKDPMKGLKLHTWQVLMKEIINEECLESDRTIHWWYDISGCTGKTTWCKYLCINYNCLYLGGKSNDIKFAVTEWLKKKDLHLVCFDLVRSMENYISYEAIEAVKNGIFFSGKYEGGMCIFNKPHVFVFANYKPEYKKLSLDRWDIREMV